MTNEDDNQRYTAEIDALRSENQELRAMLDDAYSIHKHYERSADHAYEWLWEVDANGIYTYASSGVMNNLGYLPEELIGKSPFDFMPQTEAERVGQIFLQIVSEEASFAKLFNICLHKNGQKVYTETSGKPFYDKHGRLAGYRGIDIDRTDEITKKEQLQAKALELEAELYQKEQLLCNVIDSASDLIFYKDPEFRYLGCNQAFSNFLGLPIEYIIGKSDFELFPQELAELFRSKDIPVINNLVTYSNHEWVEHANGSRLYLLTQKSPLIDKEGKLIGMVGISRNVTKEHKLEQEIKEAHQHLVDAQQIAKVGHWEWDMQTNNLRWSDEIFRIFGHQAQAFPATYQLFLDTIHPDDRTLVQAAVGMAIDEQNEYNITHRIILPDGTIKSVHEIGYAVFDDQGVPVRMIGTVHDITLLQRVEAKLAEQEEAFKTVYEHSSDGVLLIKDGKFFACNQAAVEMLKTKSESDVFDLLPSEISPEFQPDGIRSAEKEKELIAACLEKGSVRFDWVHTDSNGKEFWVDVLLTRLLINRRYIIHVSWRDISERKELERELEETNKRYKDLVARLDIRVKEQSTQLVKQSRMAQMGELLSMIAHQWRQPLSSIAAVSSSIKLKIDLGQVDLGDEQKVNAFQDYVHKQMDEIEAYVSSLSATIDDFRTLYKPDKTMHSHSVTEPVKRALSLVERSFREHSIRVEESYETDTAVSMHNNEVMQVVLNLLKNAEDNFVEKATKGPKISIKTILQDDSVVIEISDNGGGIDESIIDKIFDPYFSTKNEKNGTGLGLYMCKIIIEEHQKGKLQVQNIPGGACFTIELPLA